MASSREKNTTVRTPDLVATALACLGPLGRSPIAPGTLGSAVAAISAPWIFLSLPVWARGALLIALFLAGSVAAGHVEKMTGRTDPRCVIIDEVVGQWLTYLPIAVPAPPWKILAGFLLFRVFDVIKPWPVRSSELWLPGGFGVMLDDVLAGIYATLVLCLLGGLVP